jgi:hypothetical protein
MIVQDKTMIVPVLAPGQGLVVGLALAVRLGESVVM